MTNRDGKPDDTLNTGVSAADQENAKRRDERAASADGMTAAERAMQEPASPAPGGYQELRHQLREAQRGAVERLMDMDDVRVHAEAMFEVLADAPEGTQIYAGVASRWPERMFNAENKTTVRGVALKNGEVRFDIIREYTVLLREEYRILPPVEWKVEGDTENVSREQLKSVRFVTIADQESRPRG